MRVAGTVNCAFESTSGAAATMAKLLVDANGLLLLHTTIESPPVATPHE
jgi:hypothetical protein